MWRCKKCGGAMIKIATIPVTFITEIKKNGKSGKVITHGKHKQEHSGYFQCVLCKQETHTSYLSELEEKCTWEE